ncbi:MAG: DUF5519 family protein [Armatimonas sp.]
MKLLGFLSQWLRPVRYLIPLPQLLDMFFWLHTFVFHQRVFRVLEALIAEANSWSYVHWSLHRFGGIEWRVNGQEIGHLHGNGILDIRLPNFEAAKAAQRDNLALEHHTYPGSAWVSLPLQRHTQLPTALALLQQAAENFLADRNHTEPPCVMIL